MKVIHRRQTPLVRSPETRDSRVERACSSCDALEFFRVIRRGLSFEIKKMSLIIAPISPLYQKFGHRSWNVQGHSMFFSSVLLVAVLPSSLIVIPLIVLCDPHNRLTPNSLPFVHYSDSKNELDI